MAYTRDRNPLPRNSHTVSTRAEEKAWFKRPPTLFGFALAAAVVFSALWNPPTASVHSFSQASDYVASRDAGCTNSGEGCHGSETAYTDFNDYHPDAECTTCHEYEGVGCIPCHTPREKECAACHDGTMEGASDCVHLADPYPSGHYRETTHTAMGTDMDREVRTAESGLAVAACKDCHSRDLKSAHTGVPVVGGSTYGDSVNCGECHNDVRSSGLVQVTSDWPDRSCEVCHDLAGSSPMHGTRVAPSVESSGSAGCGSTGAGCHDVDDLHALHPDAPQTCSGSAGEGEPGCHDLAIESHKPAIESCGGGDIGSCHLLYRTNHWGHEADRDNHSPGTSVQARQTFRGVPCRDCHDMASDGTSLQDEHALATSARSLVGDNVCRNCHNARGSQDAIADEWAARDSASACASCHDGSGIDAAHERDLSAVHDVSSSSVGCADSGAGCHDSADLSVVGAGSSAIHDDCLTCHDPSASDGNVSYTPGAASCGEGRSCHNVPGAYDPDTGSHPGVNGDDDAHRASQAQAAALLYDTASGRSVPCSDCHAMTLEREHTRPNALGTDGTCTACHGHSDATAAVVKADWSGSGSEHGCAACHGSGDLPEPHGRIDEVHRAVQIGHTGEPSDTGCARGGCHPSADVRVVHGDVGCAIDGCHSNDGDIRGARILTCGGDDPDTACHADGSHHANKNTVHFATELHRTTGEPDPGACERAGCHATTDVREIHENTHCSTPGCHVEGGPTYMSCGGPEGAPACHAGSARHTDADDAHQAVELDSSGEPNPGGCVHSGCHGTTDVREIHETTHCSTPGCHVEGGPTYMSCGGPEGAEACHGPTARHDGNHSADMTGTVDGIAYGPGENLGCFGCHATSLTTEHRNRLNAGELEGGGVNTCSICHAQEGDPGRNVYASLPAVVEAIRLKDRRCIACHASGTGVDGPEAVAPPTASCVIEPVPTRSLASVTGGGMAETVPPRALEPSSSVEPIPAGSSSPTSGSVEPEPVSDETTSTTGPTPPPTDAQEPTTEPSCTFDGSAENTAPATAAAGETGAGCTTCHASATD